MFSYFIDLHSVWKSNGTYVMLALASLLICSLYACASTSSEPFWSIRFTAICVGRERVSNPPDRRHHHEPAIESSNLSAVEALLLLKVRARVRQLQHTTTDR